MSEGNKHLALTLAFLAGAAPVFAWRGGPTPHDDAKLVVMPRAVLQDSAGEHVKPVKDATSPLGTAFDIAQPRSAVVQVPEPGSYTAWVRLRHPRRPLHVTISQGDRKLAEATIGSGRGDKDAGGPSGFQAYYDAAMESTANAATLARQLGYAGDATISETSTDMTDLVDSFVEDVSDAFVSMHRVERRIDSTPWYWWKAFTVDLQPGDHALAFDPAEETGPDNAPRLDAAILTTAEQLVYPYLGDFVVPPGTYVRFRIDALPPGGKLNISGSMRIHFDPWQSDPLPFGALGFPTDLGPKLVPHTNTGYTTWYRLQDIRNVPGGGSASLLLSISDHAQAKGATQFASFPHPDQVVREFDWHEPDGTRISMNMNVAGARHQLVTYRDLERLHYDWALEATGNRLYPLTRGRQAFGNAAGGATGAAQDYMFKVLRLLGFNAVASTDPAFYHKHYGGASAGGHYWPPVFMPYDVESAAAQYDGHYKRFFEQRRAAHEHMRIFQIADEPVEINQAEMSAPLWEFVPDDAGGRWIDRTGLSTLHTRKTDYENCVLEGNFQVHGGLTQVMGFRVGTDDSRQPKKFGYWRVGRRKRSALENLASGVTGGSSGAAERKGASIGTRAHRFKIVYEGSAAFLYVDDVLMSALRDVPPRGGFGFFGQQKSIWGLHFRPLESGDRMVATMDAEPEGALDDEDGELGDILDDMLADEAPDWAKPKPLDQMIEEDWVEGGGIAGSHESFRRWLTAREIRPALFGKKSMEDVKLLTIRGLARSPADRKRYYWSRRFSADLTPRMFAQAAEAIHKHAPNKEMETFVALSGHALYMHGPTMPLDMFALARLGGNANMMGGCSDYMTAGGSWWWDSHEAVAYTAAFSNSGGRNYTGPRHGFPMMHCALPTTYRSYVQLGSQVKYISYFWYGPSYAGTEYLWSENRWSYHTVSGTANRTAQVDDILSPGEMRPSRVALLYSRASEYWDNSAWVDKRCLFLGLGHDYFRPELITEEQITVEDALAHYDALYVAEPNVASAAQARIAQWVQQGGLLWSAARAGTRNEYNDPEDLLRKTASLGRKPAAAKSGDDPLEIRPVDGESDFEPYRIFDAPHTIDWPGCRVRARYSDGRIAWAEKGVGQGHVVFLGHQAGAHYSRHARRNRAKATWNENVRTTFTTPLKDAGIEREVVVDRPVIFASPLSTPDGTVVVIFNTSPNIQTNVQVGIREPRMPHSVQIFDRLNPVDADTIYKDGRVWVTVPQLHRQGAMASQMVVVRRKPAPADPRDEAMRARTVRDLDSKDGRVLSSALWFAGFRPEWNLADKIPPFLSHPDWNARRSAAEAIGRLRHTAAIGALRKAMKDESDGHVLADQLIALAELDTGAALADSLDVLQRDTAKVRARQTALNVLSRLFEEETTALENKQRAAVTSAAATYAQHPDARLANAAKELSAVLASAD